MAVEPVTLEWIWWFRISAYSNPSVIFHQLRPRNIIVDSRQKKATVEVQLEPTSLHELGGGSSVLKKANFPLSAKL